MKIAVWHNLPSGGGKRALYYHVKGLLERGHTIEAWCPPTADQTYLPLSELVPEHIVPLQPNRKRGRGAIARLHAKYNHVVEAICAMDEHCQRCGEEINRKNFDVLFANSCMFFRTTSIGRYANLPRLLYLQEPYRWLYEAMPTFPWAAPPVSGKPRWSFGQIQQSLGDALRIRGMRIQVRAELSNAKHFDTMLVNSLFSRESVLRAYGLNSAVCYLGIDTSLFVNRHSARENFVVGVGAFVPEKNIELAITGVSRVRHNRPALVWIGNVADPQYTAELKRIADSTAVKLEMHSRVTDKELVDFLNKARLMIYAPRLEPFGFAPLEANACGLPVVAVAEGGVRETVVNGVNGLLVTHDADDIANAMERLLSCPEYATSLGRQGQTYVSEFWSLDSSIDRLERHLSRIGSVPYNKVPVVNLNPV